MGLLLAADANAPRASAIGGVTAGGQEQLLLTGLQVREIRTARGLRQQRMGEAYTPSRMDYGPDGRVVVGVPHSRDQAFRIRWQTRQEAIIGRSDLLPRLGILTL